MFAHDYLSVKTTFTPAMNKIYVAFKEYVENVAAEREPYLRESYLQESSLQESLLQDLTNYARRYEILLRGGTEDKGLNASVERLNRLCVMSARPFFLEVLRLREEGTLSFAEVREIFLYTENYLFRRMICNLPTNSLDKLFRMLHREIVRYDGTEDDYLEKFKYALNSRSERRRFPDDKEFRDAFSTHPVYRMYRRNQLYVLERFENYGTVEVHDVYRQCDDGVYSVEHVMPQVLTPAWTRELGENYEEIHKTWLHRMANLTLTGYNSRLSNCPFVEKRDMKNGFRESHLYLNHWIGSRERWGLEELEARNELLMERALSIWARPETHFKPPEKPVESCSLDDEAEWRGREIARFAYRNVEQPVTGWGDMLERVLKLLHAEDRAVLSRLAYAEAIPDGELSGDFSDELSELASWVSHEPPEDLRRVLKIDADIYVKKNPGVTANIALLRKLFKAYGVNEEDLVFYLKRQGGSK